VGCEFFDFVAKKTILARAGWWQWQIPKLFLYPHFFSSVNSIHLPHLPHLPHLYKDKLKTLRQLLCILFIDCNEIATFKLESLAKYKCVDDVDLYLAEAQSLALARTDALMKKAAKNL
jgi:hypothetical protein